MREDSDLLRQYASEGSNEAFGRLVERHCNLVWGAAYRILGDADLARDVAQTTFATLARKAGRIPSKVILAGWLYQTARLSAAMMARTDARRAQREEHAMRLQELLRPNPDENKAAEELQPLLDAALGELDETDRDAIVLRFLSGRSLADVAAALGGTENAARMRVSRALEKLRDSFRRRGVEVSAGILAAALGVAGSQAAPVALAAALAAGALAGASLPAAVTATTLMKSNIIIGLVKSKIVLGLAAAAMAGGLVWQHQQVQQTQEENAALRRQLTEQAAPPAAASTDAAPAEETKRQQDERLELMRLRGEYAQWQRQTASSAAQISKLQKEVAAVRQEAGQRAEAFAQETTRQRQNASIAGVALHANACLNNLVKINGAKEQWALENRQVNGSLPQDSDLFGPTRYIAAKPVCPDGGVYTLNAIGTAPTCTVSGHTLP